MKQPSQLLLMTVASIFALGIVMIFGTSSAEVIDHALDISTHHALARHALYSFLGMSCGFLLAKVGYRALLNLTPILLGFFTVLLVLTLIPGIGFTANGASRWIRIGGYTLQPSEFVKILAPALFIQEMLRLNMEEIRWKELATVLGKVTVPMLLIMIEPDNGTTAIIGVTIMALFVLMKVPMRFWLAPTLVLILAAGVVAVTVPYVSSRLQVYLNPELDVRGRGHQPLQARIAAGSGGLWGRGPGQSLQKLSYLPEAQNDYIAAIYAEEFGFIGVSGLIGLYLLFTYLGFHIAMTSKDYEGFCLAGMLTFLVSIQAFLNLGVVSGLLPSTGLNLPFFSQGGTSLMANLIAVAILYDIAATSERARAPLSCKCSPG